jgi:3-oxoadipate enol-lactonase
MKAVLSPDAWLEYDEAGSGRPVVLVHAGLRADCRLLLPDLRGFGGSSPAPEPPSVEGMADDVAVWLDALRVDQPVVLGGLSMGGYVALAFARKYPARLHGLILADTRAEADSAEAKANRDKMIALAQSRPARDVIEQMLPKALAPETLSGKPEVVEEVRRIASAQRPEGIVAALRALRDRPDASGSLAAVRAPTLVLVGSEDVLTPPALAEKLAAGIPGARLEKIAGAGHLSNLEQPDAFNTAVRSFLRTVAGGA